MFAEKPDIGEKVDDQQTRGARGDAIDASNGRQNADHCREQTYRRDVDPRRCFAHESPLKQRGNGMGVDLDAGHIAHGSIQTVFGGRGGIADQDYLVPEEVVLAVELIIHSAGVDLLVGHGCERFAGLAKI